MRTRKPTHRFCAAAAILLALLVNMGCADDDAPSEDRPTADERSQPLQPLVFTEDPDHTPKAAAVRERRLMRRLLEGSARKGSGWGTLDSEADRGLPDLDSPEKLGRVVFRALIEQDDRSWDHIFVAPRDYASLVRVELAKARKFVDRQQADAVEARRRFQIEKRSEAPKDGLGSVFEFVALHLGEGRTVGGSIADEDEVVAQHWNNILKLGLVGGDVTFEIRIRKILRLHLPGGPDESRTSRLGVASDIRIGRRLGVFLDAGMHLKTELLRSFDYPFPLEVGNYWRYARRPAEAEESKPDEESPSPAETSVDEGLPPGMKASEVTMRVESVDRYSTRRLVKLQFAYNDAKLTRSSEYWLVTPRRVFVCPRPCRRHVEDLNWLLSYLGRQTPIFKFPLDRGIAWGEPVYPSRQQAAFTTEEKWHNVEVPAGSFFGTLAIRGIGPLTHRVPFHPVRRLTRYFAPGKGVVRRTYRRSWSAGTRTIVESLIDYRIMSR